MKPCAASQMRNGETIMTTNYEKLRKQTNRGWNTWYSPSMTSHVRLPDGFCIALCFKDPSVRNVIRDLKPDNYGLRPGARSADGSYTELSLKPGDTGITVQSAAVDGEQYILVKPDVGGEPPTLIVEAQLLWGRPGSVFLRDGRLGAELESGERTEVFTTGKPSDYVHSHGTAPCLRLKLDAPVAVSTKPASVEEVEAIIESAKKKLDEEDARYGDNALAFSAMRSCLAWNTIYEPEHDSICTPVSRGWSHGNGGYVLCEWDTYFAALMSSLFSRELAYLNAYTVTAGITPDGFVPNVYASSGVTFDRSQPPVGSLVTLRLWERFGDDDFVCELFPRLYRWNTWFLDNRTLPDGTMCWGSGTKRAGAVVNVGNLQFAKYESGLDNSPMYDDAVFDEKTGLMMVEDVGLTALFAEDCRCLAKLAAIVGDADAIAVLEKRMRLAEDALETLWNEETGIYENRDAISGRFLHRISPTNLYALFSHSVDDERKKLISERYILNPDELGGAFMLPSISRSDAAYPEQTYWRGRIWAPMNYLVYEALKEAGMTHEAQLLAQSSRRILLDEWSRRGHVHENYSGIDGSGCHSRSDSFYHWGGLLGYIAVTELHA